MRRFGPNLLVICGLQMAACYTGTSAGGDGSSSSSGEDSDDDASSTGEGSEEGGDETESEPTPPACAPTGDVGVSQVHRLTRPEYDLAVRDLLGSETQIDSDRLAISDGRVGPFSHNANKPPAQETVEDYRTLAEAAADQAAARLDELVPCDLEAAECPGEFIVSLGRRAYRRPLTQEERDRLQIVFGSGSQTGLVAGYRLVISALLQSPNFLYRIELGDGPSADGLTTLSPLEVASRLSFFLHGGPPDEELLAAAEAGALETSAEIEARVREMLDDPRAADMLGSFPARWLGVDGVERLDRGEAFADVFDDALWDQMREEVRRIGTEVLFEGDARLSTLLTTQSTFVTPELAELYGVETQGAGWSRVELDPSRRSGVLTSLGFLAVTAHPDQTSPVLRGAAIRELLLCTELPPPPSDVNDTPPEVDPNLPTRERFDEHRDNPSCAGCHVLMDPLGYGFENYDPVGRYRLMEGGQPVDASGEIHGTLDTNGPFDDAIGLIDRLAESEDVARCVQTQVFRWGNGRSPDTADTCSQDAAFEVFADSDYDVRELIVALTVSDAFRYRRVAEMENDNE